MSKKLEMKTQILLPNAKNISLASDSIKAGEVVAFGTETVYGLGANAFDSQAVSRIFKIKGRPNDNPLIVHIDSLLRLQNLVSYIPDTAYKLAEKFMPGPITLVLPKSKLVPAEVSAGLDTVGVRMPNHKKALEFIASCGCSLAAPSANISGFVSPTTATHVYNDLKGKLKYILDTGNCQIGLESTVIDLSAKTPMILRQGAISKSQIQEAVGQKVLSCFSPFTTDRPASPGMKYRHYAPNAKVLFSSYHEKMFENINAAYDEALKNKQKPIILCLAKNKDLYGKRVKYLLGQDYKEYAQSIYAVLRTVDNDGFKTIIAEGVQVGGIGNAIINRLMKASQNNII